MWREENNIPCGEHRTKNKVRALGSRIPMPRAKDQLENFLTKPIRDVVRTQVCDSNASAGKLFAKPRFFNDLLSSQPLCFNLFGELTYDLDLISEIVNDFTQGRFTKVTSVDFEFSPGRGDLHYLGDSSAFDVTIGCHTKSGGRGFIGIEVKYHENLKGTASDHKSRYDEVARSMGCFQDNHSSLQNSPLQQIWRDHLLAGITQINDGYDDALFVMLHPRDNIHVTAAINEYMKNLKRVETFASWTLEDFVSKLREKSTNAWIEKFYDRYLAFDKIKNGLSS
jgi:hypothetical protein